MKQSSRQIILIVFILGALFYAVLSAHAAPKRKLKGQTQPDSQRIAEIQAALTAHGYTPGTTWPETKEACRKIADEHGWQNMYAPDTRVLILLGLTNNDPDVATLPGNQLDKDQRKWVEQNGLPKGER